MTRLEKKCLVGAAGMHGLLLVIVLASSAFQGEPPKQTTTMVNFIPSVLLDKAEAGGGTPAPAVTPAPAAQTPAAQPAQPKQEQKPVEQPKPEPVKPAPKVVKTEPVPDRPKEIKHHDPEPDLSDFQPIESSHPTVLIPKKKPTKRLHSADDIKVDLGHTTSLKAQRKAQQAKELAQAEADEEAAAIAYNNSVKRALGKIGSEVVRGIGDKTSGLTVIGKVGTGGGGESYAGYEQYLGGVFYRAWVPPDGVSDTSTDTEVEIVVARDGTVISARITSGSTRSMDRSVQAALNKVRKLRPFPEGATDSQRTFQMVFNLKAKQSAG